MKLQISTDLASLCIKLSFEMPSEERAYEQGYNAAIEGTNTTNCHFTLFATKSLMEAWTAGNRAGEKFNGIR